VTGQWFKGTPLLVFGVVFTLYFVVALTAETPGRNDGLVYYHVAQSLVAGEGLSQPYIWNYLAFPRGLPTPAFGYWMPLATFLCAGSMSIFGTSIWAALLPNALLVAVLSVMAARVVGRLGGSTLWCFFAAFAVALSPLAIKYGTTTQAVLPSAVFGCGALMVAGRWWDGKSIPSGWYEYFGAGLLVGLASLGRGDGQLVLVVVLISLLGSLRHTGTIRKSFKPVILVIFGMLLVMAPWGARNISVFGVPSPPGAAKALLAVEYEDIYSYAKTPTAKDYLAAASDDPLGFLATKAKAAGSIGTKFLMLYGPLVLVAVLARSRRRLSGWFVVGLGHLVVCWMFYSFVGTEVGPTSAPKASLVALPLLAGVGASGLSVMSGRRRVVVASLLLFLIAWSAIPMVQLVRNRYMDHAWVGEAVLAGSGEGTPVVMSRKPWRIWEDVGLGAIQLPNDDLEDIVAAAEEFGANYLLLRFAAEREALAGIYSGTQFDPRFEWMAESGSQKLFLLHVDKLDKEEGGPNGR
jgi:4-amino-4-deoxy-L-arabinose transferase-like glycosyltransferase